MKHTLRFTVKCMFITQKLSSNICLNQIWYLLIYLRHVRHFRLLPSISMYKKFANGIYLFF